MHLKALCDIKVDEGRDLVETHVMLLRVELRLRGIHLIQDNQYCESDESLGCSYDYSNVFGNILIGRYYAEIYTPNMSHCLFMLLAYIRNFTAKRVKKTREFCHFGAF